MGWNQSLTACGRDPSRLAHGLQILWTVVAASVRPQARRSGKPSAPPIYAWKRQVGEQVGALPLSPRPRRCARQACIALPCQKGSYSLAWSIIVIRQLPDRIAKGRGKGVAESFDPTRTCRARLANLRLPNSMSRSRERRLEAADKWHDRKRGDLGHRHQASYDSTAFLMEWR